MLCGFIIFLNDAWKVSLFWRMLTSKGFVLNKLPSLFHWEDLKESVSAFGVCVRDCFPLEGPGGARKAGVMLEASWHANGHEREQRLLRLCEQNMETGREFEHPQTNKDGNGL